MVAPTVKDSSYWAGGPSIPTVLHAGPALPGGDHRDDPGRTDVLHRLDSAPWLHPSSEIEQYHELLTATGALVGSGFCPFRSHGAIMNSKHVM